MGSPEPAAHTAPAAGRFSVLICDDSEFARKQIARALPPGWDVDIHHVADGMNCLEAVRDGGVDILFLDLNMPGMDGYQVLESIRREDLDAMVVVISGDVQPQARERVIRLGALDFLGKPVRGSEIKDLLQRYGIDVSLEASPSPAAQSAAAVSVLDGCREIANIAIGRAADRIARLLEVFIEMPVPTVGFMAPSDLKMTFAGMGEEGATHVVCQGFAGAGLRGEVLMMVTAHDLARMGTLLHGSDQHVDANEVLLEMAGTVIGSCLNGVADQLEIGFSFGQPVVIGQGQGLDELVRSAGEHWNNALAIEMNFKIEAQDTGWNILLLLTEASMAQVQERLSLLLG